MVSRGRSYMEPREENARVMEWKRIRDREDVAEKRVIFVWGNYISHCLVYRGFCFSAFANLLRNKMSHYSNCGKICSGVVIGQGSRFLFLSSISWRLSSGRVSLLFCFVFFFILSFFLSGVNIDPVVLILFLTLNRDAFSYSTLCE